MIIEELKIGRFAGFENRTFNFSEGINLIEGENESGKSSIAEFIRFIFYGMKDGAKKRNAPCFGYLVLSCQKGRFRIERSLSFNGELSDERVTIVDLQINAPLKGKDPAAMFLGVSEDIFERSCFFSQFGARAVDGQALASALENMLSSADEQINAEKSAGALDEAIRMLRGEGEEHDESVPALLRKKEELGVRYEKACAMEAEYRRTAESYAENKKKAEGNKKSLEECRALLGHSDALHRLEHIKRANEAKDRLAECQGKLEHAKAALAENGFLPDALYVKNLRSLAEKGHRYEEAVLEKQQECARLKEELAQIPLPPSGREGALLEKVAKAGADAQMNKNYFIGCLGAAGLFLILTLIFAILQVVAGAVIAGILMLAAVGGALWFFLKKRQAKERENALYALAGAENREGLARAVEEWARCTERRAGLERQIEDTERKRAKAEEGRTSALSEGAQLAAQWGKPCGTVKSLTLLSKNTARALEHLTGLENEEKQLRLEYADLQVSYTQEELQGLIDTVRAQDGREELSAEEYKKIKMKVNFYDQTSRALEERTAKQQQQMAELESTMEDRHLLEHELALLEEQMAKTKERIEVLTLAREAIVLAVTTMREKILPGILQDASDFLKSASAGRYTELKVNEAFELLIKDGQSGEEKTVAQLSAAMGDLAYIALRMAVSRRLYGEQETVLAVFDESFSHLDDLRLASLFMTLAGRTETGGHQIFFMTCRKREGALLEKIARVNKITL